MALVSYTDYPGGPPYTHDAIWLLRHNGRCQKVPYSDRLESLPFGAKLNAQDSQLEKMVEAQFGVGDERAHEIVEFVGRIRGDIGEPPRQHKFVREIGEIDNSPAIILLEEDKYTMCFFVLWKGPPAHGDWDPLLWTVPWGPVEIVDDILVFLMLQNHETEMTSFLYPKRAFEILFAHKPEFFEGLWCTKFEDFQKIQLAFAMVGHSRLGRDSGLRDSTPELVSLIMQKTVNLHPADVWDAWPLRNVFYFMSRKAAAEAAAEAAAGSEQEGEQEGSEQEGSEWSD